MHFFFFVFHPFVLFVFNSKLVSRPKLKRKHEQKQILHFIYFACVVYFDQHMAIFIERLKGTLKSGKLFSAQSPEPSARS